MRGWREGNWRGEGREIGEERYYNTMQIVYLYPSLILCILSRPANCCVLITDYKYHCFLVWPWSDSCTLTLFYKFSVWPWVHTSTSCHCTMLQCSDIIIIFANRKSEINDRDVTKWRQVWDTSALPWPSLQARKTGHCMHSVSIIFYWRMASL